jgi:hypothetical protein
VKAQGKHAPEVMVMFKPVLDFFARVRPAATPPATPSRRGEIVA